MKKLFTIAAMAALALPGAKAQTSSITYDFEPQLQTVFFQEVPDPETGDYISQVRIEVKFDEDVWWVSGFSKQCYLLDSNGVRYDDWTPDFSGPASDYTAFYFVVCGLNKYEDADYTLVIPEGLLGNTPWNSNHDTGRANPELRYEFNAWKLAGEPRENFTVYDFEPSVLSQEVVEVRDKGKKFLELQLTLEFPEPVAISKNLSNVWNVRDAEGNALSDDLLTARTTEDKPAIVIVGLRGIDFKVSADYTISIWKGGFGTLDWAADDYYSGHSNPPLEYVVNPVQTGVDDVMISTDSDSRIYNLHGIEVDPSSIGQGIYIRDGKKIVVR